ncbi:OsmC family protein [Metabacillus niabensis]|uniref:OsmC family protein n=1 Tax=Metabacillus niabensis TaxID=324854 RepID=UPI001CFBD414|nr:OsmC family protein [Metabacillus niabensis]
MDFKMKEEEGFTTTTEFGELHVAGDEQYGYRPFQLMVASIVVCSGGVLRKILKKKRIDIEDIAISTNVERNEEKANQIEKIHIHYKIKGQNLNEKKIHQSIVLANKNCPMAQSVAGSIEIEETFELL